MKKSGRISAAAAVMGELMGIRPIITLIDGKTKVEAKVRGDDKVVPAMVELAKKRSEGVEDFDYMIGHTNIPQAADLEKACRKAFGKRRSSPLSWAASFPPTPPRHRRHGLRRPQPRLSVLECPLRSSRSQRGIFAFSVAIRPNLCYTPFCCATAQRP